VVDHFRRSRARRKGLNRRWRRWRLRTGSEQGASCGDDKGAANYFSHFWFSAAPNRYPYLRRRAMTTGLIMPVRGTPASLGSAASPLIFGAEFLEFCSHRCKPALKDTDDLFANLGSRKSGPVYEPTPAIDFILGANDYLIGITIHIDEALGLLDLVPPIIDAHGL